MTASPAMDDGAFSFRANAKYRRTLWFVVLMNVLFGILEAAGGVISGSQSLKADALDFLGDGLITFLGIVALSWRPIWRARVALGQGCFLAFLAVAVIATTLLRFQGGHDPEPWLMAFLGLFAVMVNVAAVVILIPFRQGDATVRAVWLFSRNDAIGNVAVVAAAGLVILFDSGLPDLMVALAIAGLFLHSAQSIIRHAVLELRPTNALA